MGVRINKYIASSGFCSRRQADELVETGKVTVDGVTAVNGTVVEEGQVVKVGDKEVIPEDNKIYIALHKPLGITCTTDRRDPSNIIDYLGMDDRVFPIGRLDKNSSGLILLTNDGDIVNKLLRAENGHEKEYQVRVDRKIEPGFKDKMEEGIEILGQKTLPCKVTITGTHTFNIVLKQGLNRQIRRMCDALGYRVTKLRRIRFININLGDMRPGDRRNLTKEEIRGLKSSDKAD
ncbi:MAG: pseudouridine synthase [Clostridiales bacterium]|nr:pseudouridine synthase [Clostridiales bacterium]MBP3810081.1 pseudouridine synthase [Clostridiales bacterium]